MELKQVLKLPVPAASHGANTRVLFGSTFGAVLSGSRFGLHVLFVGLYEDSPMGTHALGSWSLIVAILFGLPMLSWQKVNICTLLMDFVFVSFCLPAWGLPPHLCEGRSAGSTAADAERPSGGKEPARGGVVMRRSADTSHYTTHQIPWHYITLQCITFS